MKHTALSLALTLALTQSAVMAANDTIDISGNNTDKDYISHDKALTLAAGSQTDVLMARFCYFSSAISGTGTLNLYAGGERCYLGTAKGAQWPDWTNFTGDVNVYPYPENSSAAGFYGVVLAHGGKAFSAENFDEGLKSGKVNRSMENNRLIIHSGATLCCEANTAGSGFRIGELQTEAGSSIIGYMKKNTRPAYFIVGYTNTDATLAGTIAPPDYAATHPVGIIKEGTGTYRISGNNNFLSGSLRVLDGRVLVMDNVAETDSLKLRGALGALPDELMAVAFVFEKGTLGGTGSIAGTVDNYGTVEPGADGIGTLIIKNFAEAKDANLYVHPKSVLKFKIGSTAKHDQLLVDGSVKYFGTAQDFVESTAMPLIGVELEKDAAVAVGDEFVVLTAKSKDVKAGEWNFQLKRPDQYTWEIVESTDSGVYLVKLKITSLDAMPVVADTDTIPNYTPMGAFYDDGIDDKTDLAPLRLYAEKNGKYLGTAISTWKNDLSNANLAETKEVALQFNMLVAENEMKFDALEPSRNGFDFSGADKLVNFAQANDLVVRGHCLAWHSQLPEWVSSDGKKNDRNWSRDEALQILKNHIDKVMAHYKGKVAEWDVVNECLSDNQGTVRTKPGSYDLRQSVWTLAIGEDFIDSAFVYAHRADPDALLYLNDYDVEFQGKAKSEAFYNLAIRLKNSGIPIDGVGIQCHFSVGGVDSVKLDATVRRFAKAGLKCIITELDMGIPSTSAADLEEQARNYRVITDIVLNNDNCPNLVIWGLKDNNSWRDSSNPLLYTAGLAKKPAWYAVRSALRHRTGKIDYTPPTEPEKEEPKTGIEDESVTPDFEDDAIYDMFGRRVDGRNLKPGLYIRGGKKIYIFK